MSVNTADLVLTSLETITAFGIGDGEYLWTLDELQNATIANTQDTEDVTGKNGRLISTLKKNKAVTISGSNGMLSGGLMQTQTGSDWEEKVTEVMYPDYLTVANDTAVTTYTAVGTAGNEIAVAYIHQTSGILGDSFTQGDSTGEGVFTYDPDTKTITFNSGEVADGTEIVVYYYRRIKAHVLENISDKYSEKCALYIDGFAEDKCANVYRIQFYIPKADFSGEFDIEMSDSQSAHSFEARALAGGYCNGTAEYADTLWTYTVFDDEAKDVDENGAELTA